MADQTNTTDMGEVSPQLRNMMERYQRESQNITLQIGNLEIRKAQLLGHLDALSNDLQRLINAEAARLGIPKGAQWQIDPDGHAIVIDGPTKTE